MQTPVEPRPPLSAGSGAVLLVDDDRHVLRALERTLRRSFEVIVYESARAAVEHVRAGGVSVVVSDLEMPEMTGLELLAAIRAHDPDLPVVLITGIPTLDTATKAIEYGVFRYFKKPFEPELLQSTIEQAVRLYRLARMKRVALELSGHPAGASDRVGLELSFRSALEALWVAFQPIVCMSRCETFGYEALMRSADAALPGPLEMLSAAERLDALPLLGRLVRQRAAEKLSGAGEDALLFVNLHPRDLVDPELSDPSSPLAMVARRVVLEVTERASLMGLRDVQARVARLRSLGYRIAIDDLGAGYAGLTSFALLEPEFVKIDMSLTRGIDANPVKQKLVASLTSLCREMSMTVVAEGVETPAERDALVSLGCDFLQGYLFAKPGPPFPAARI